MVGVAGRYSNRPNLLQQLRKVAALVSDGDPRPLRRQRSPASENTNPIERRKPGALPTTLTGDYQKMLVTYITV